MAEHINLKTNEVNNLRFISRSLLYQKSELDKFFLETIEHIKNAQEHTNHSHENSINSSRTPRAGGQTSTFQKISTKTNLPISKYGTLHWGKKAYKFEKYDAIDIEKLKNKRKIEAEKSSNKSRATPKHQNPQEIMGDKKVELSDLSWDEVEKIVRILYTQINMGVTPHHWRQIERLAKEREEEDEIGVEVEYNDEGMGELYEEIEENLENLDV